ncbi:MAG: cation:proton antiporter [Rhodocyclaceae bacterium]
MDDFLPISNPVQVFALVAALILLAPIVMERWRLPGMIGLLIAGAVLGPNALGVLARDQSFILLGTVGLLYIMFSAALEIDMSILRRYRLHSLVFGLMTFSVPMGLGLVVAHYLLGFAWPAAILLASTFASHTLLTYPIASRLGITRNRAVTTAVGGTIITDTLALLVLAVIASSTKGEIHEYFWHQLGISLVVYVVAILVGLPLLARWFFRNLGRDGVSEFVFVLAAVFGCAALSHLAGSEPIVGAFLAGLALNRLIPHHGTLMNRIQFTGEAIFVPFFLLSVGMLLDVSIFLSGPRAWAVAIAMSVTVVVTKWLAAESTRVLLRYDRDQARVVFGLSVPQAAATLAATLVGYDLGLFDDAVVNGAILMILVSCIIAPIMVDRHGRALALANAEVTTERDGQHQRLIVGCARLETARPLLELAVLLRDRARDQPIYPLTVVQEGPDAADAVEQAEKMLTKAVAQLAAAEVPAQPLTRIDLNASSGIIRARRELRATAVVVGWRDRAEPRERFFGSMLEHLLRDRHYALLMSRLVEPVNTTRRIVVALPPYAELEAGFPVAMRLLANLVSQLGASVVIVAEGQHEARVRSRLAGFKALKDARFQTVPRWTALRTTLVDSVGNGDLVVVYSVRPGGLAWEPLLATLPTRLAARLSHTNLIALYPPEPRAEQDEPAVYAEAATTMRL